MAVEKMLRSLDRDLRVQCKDLFGQEILQPQPPVGGEASAVEAEARGLVPLEEGLQVHSLSGLRSAQQQLGAALAEFLRLPQKLKAVFDLTKTLSSEIGGLVPAAMLQQAETQAAAARLQSSSTSSTWTCCSAGSMP